MLVRRFAEIGLGDRATVGGKGASLGELDRIGVRVPPGFVVTTDAYRDAVAAVRLPERVREAVLAAYAELGADAPVAVRSSATAEDSADASFAGVQDTYLWVRGAESVLDHVRRCWASLHSVESVAYRQHRGLTEDGLAMGVVVQRMVDARCAGVMFTRSPLTGDRSVVAIEAAWGLGSALVGGDVTPDRFVVNKVTGEIVQRSVSTKERRHRMDPSGTGVLDDAVPADLRDAPCLTDADVRALVTLARRIEDHYGAPQDIEWAIENDGLYVLQSRPETVWARRDVAPVAAPRARAFDHVFDLLGRSARAD
jgi:pyruvate,water dikinase